jgi:acetyl esterase/lipase
MMGAQASTLLVVLLLHFCSPLPLLNALAPRDTITRTQDIPYADGPRRRLDIYSPARSDRPAPVVVFFYGGGWETGSKAMYRFVGATLASRGLVVVIPDYRLHPEVQFPGFVNDAATAVAWVHDNAARFGGDPHRLFLMGHSAGAQIATLLALDATYLKSAGLSPRDLCGVIGLAGTYDFHPLKRHEFEAIFGPETDWPRSSPISFVTPESPRMLLLAGLNDGTVEPGNTFRLAAKLRSVGVPVTEAAYPGISHIALVAALSRPLTFLAPVEDATLEFVEADQACHAAH